MILVFYHKKGPHGIVSQAVSPKVILLYSNFTSTTYISSINFCHFAYGISFTIIHIILFGIFYASDRDGCK